MEGKHSTEQANTQGLRDYKNSSKAIQKKINYTFCFLFISIICLHSLSANYQYNQNKKLVINHLNQVDNAFYQALKEEAEELEVALTGLLNNENLVYPFEQKDRATLLANSNPIFLHLKDTFNIIHFHFSDVNRTTFLRLDEPELHGDVISRHTMLEAQQQKVTSSGLEHDRSGALTLLVAVPWYSKGQLLGYVELGISIHHIFTRIEKNFGITLIEAIRKDFLPSDSNRQNLNLEEWRFFETSMQQAHNPKTVLLATKKPMAQQLYYLFKDILKENKDISQIQVSESQSTLAMALPLFDIDKNYVGHVLIAHDISDLQHTIIHQLSIDTSATLIIFLLGFILLKQILKKFGVSIENTYSNLDKIMEKQSTDLMLRAEKLREAQSIAKCGSWELNIKTNQLSWSDEVYRIFAVDPGNFKVSYESFLKLIHPDDKENVNNTYMDTLEKKEPIPIYHRILIKGENIKWVCQQFKAKYTQNGEPLIFGTIQEATEQINTELALKESEEKSKAIIKYYKSIVRYSTEGIIVTDRSGIIINNNPAVLNTLNTKNQTLIGREATSFLPDFFSDIEQLCAGIETGEFSSVSKDTIGIREDGSEFPLRLGLGEMKLRNNRLFVISINDLSNLKKLETQLKHAQKMDVIGKLSGGIAHDFNNILGIIIGQLDLIMLKLDPNSALVKRVEKANKAALRAARLTKKLLSISCQSINENTPVNINKVIHEIQDLISKSLTARIGLKTLLAKDIWTVEIDAGGLEDALLNLALNAKDAISHRGHLILETSNLNTNNMPAWLRTTFPQGCVKLTVTDNGKGIPEQHLQNIFEPFFTTKDKGEGTGLGLAMVYGFVESADGKVNVYSELGKGTTFNFYFPRCKASASDTAHLPVVHKEMPRGEQTILVVDDEEELSLTACHYLDELGYTTISTNNAEQALNILNDSDEVDCLFTDIILSQGQDGFELARQARAMRPNLKILFTSGYTGNKNSLQSQREFNDNKHQLISKPYRKAELATKIWEVLNKPKKPLYF